METPDPPNPGHSHNTGLITVGFIVVTMGVLMLADRWTDRDVPLMHAWWPFLLMAMGVARLANPDIDKLGRRRSSRSGVWLIVVGIWGVISEAHLFGFTYGTSWPLLVIGSGLLIVWRALDPDGASPARREP